MAYSRRRGAARGGAGGGVLRGVADPRAGPRRAAHAPAAQRPAWGDPRPTGGPGNPGGPGTASGAVRTRWLAIARRQQLRNDVAGAVRLAAVRRLATGAVGAGALVSRRPRRCEHAHLWAEPGLQRDLAADQSPRTAGGPGDGRGQPADVPSR